MKKKLSFVFLFFGISVAAIGQKGLKYAVVTHRHYNGYYVIDTLGNILVDSILRPDVPEPYNWRYNEGIFKFGALGNMGYKDIHNKIVLPADHGEVSDFVNGAGIVNKDEVFGVVNKKGAWIVPQIYSSIVHADTNGLLLVTAGNGRIGLMNVKGETILKPTYLPFASPAKFTDGLMAVWKNEPKISPEKNRSVGFINTKGALVIDTIWKADSAMWKDIRVVIHMDIFGPRYGSKTVPAHDYYRFEGGKSLARKEGKNVVINKKGTVLYTLPDTLEHLYNYGGLFAFNNETRANANKEKITYGLYSAKGCILKNDYPFEQGFRDGYLLLKRSDTSYQYLNDASQIAFGGKTFTQASSFYNGYAQVYFRKKEEIIWGLLDTKGNLISADSTYFAYYSPNEKGWLKFSQGRGKGFVDAKNKVMLSTTYADLDIFSNGYCGFLEASHGEWGYINEQNEIALPVKYEDALPFQLLKED